jgi:ADP-ribose pyrophosphatase
MPRSFLFTYIITHMKPWKTNSRKLVLDDSPWLTVEHHTVELPDGRVIPDWPWVITPDYINVVAVTEDERFICFRQVKYGIQGDTLAVVGGYIEEGEEPLAAAKRELLEETGYEAPDWLSLGSYLVDPNRGIATGHLFLARNARYITHRDADDLEEQELLLLTHEEIETALEKGEIKVLAWAAAVAFALRHL